MKDKINYGVWYECREGNMPEDVLGAALDINGYACTSEVLISYSAHLGHCHTNYISQHRTKAKGSTKWHWEYEHARPTHWLAIPPHAGNYDWLLDAENKEELLERLMI